MTQPQFNADQYRQISKNQWNQTAEGWKKWGKLLSGWNEPATKKMFDLAQITEGGRVLDVACGDGSHAVKAAKLVGKDGYVLATDMAENMVNYASQAANQAGLTQMEARVMDGENLTVDDASFDAVVCQLGLMLFANPAQGLAEAYRVLKPGGRYAAIVLTTPDKSPWLAIPAKVALEHANRPMPPPGTPGLFALGDEERLKNLMGEAGFKSVEVHTMMQPLELESAAECTLFVREIAGAIKSILSTVDEARRQAAWSAMEQALSVFEGDSGFRSPCEVRIFAGTK